MTKRTKSSIYADIFGEYKKLPFKIPKKKKSVDCLTKSQIENIKEDQIDSFKK